MLKQQPDTNVTTWELENTIQIIKRELIKSPSWQYREEYIDRGILDPYYILKIRKPEHDKLDDTGNQSLFKTKTSGLSYVCRTSDSRTSYWLDIKNSHLIKHLENFKHLYDVNKLQPPGKWGDLGNPDKDHKVFPERRFIYEIISPFKTLVGIGPNMYATGPGAVCGTVFNKNGQPLDGVVVEISNDKETLTRETRNGGLFWFSKVQSGKYQLKVKKHTCIVQVIRHDEFGNIKGWLTDENGFPVEYADIRFLAPDGEIFMAATDDTGKFSTGPLPAYPVTSSPLANYPYIMQIPEFLFSISKSITVKDAIISGVLKDNNGNVITNTQVVLKQAGETLFETKTDAFGNFRFFNLLGGSYNVEVPGQKIFLSHGAPGRIEGKEDKGMVNETRIQLVAEGYIVATERLNRSKEFAFEHIAPGKYSVEVK